MDRQIQERDSSNQALHAVWIFVLLLLCLAAACGGGCYDGEALVEAARSSALKTHLAEVDFGSYRTTLPRDAKTHTITELKLRVFGTVPRYRVSDIEKRVKAEEYRLRHQTLSALRTTTRDELAEPSFKELRKRIEKVVNEILDDAPVKSIGFYEVSLRER
jgi:flagellar basal body-associated protein FliL